MSTPVFNARFHHLRPREIARCEDADDVVQALAFAARHDLEVVARSGGHCFAGHSSTAGVVVDVSPMDRVEVHDDRVTVGAGTRLGPLYDALEPRGLAIPGGTCPTVGIAGLTLGGGLGILGRTYGLTADRLVAARIVLADGRVLATDEHQHEDLFWALRGAGTGNFGVVTSFDFRPVPAPPQVTDVHLSWPFSQAAGAIEAWQHWAPTAPDELHGSLKITAEDGSGSPEVNVYVAYVGGESDATALVDLLVSRVGADPILASTVSGTFADARRFWARLPTAEGGDEAEDQPLWFLSKSEFFRQPLPADAVAALLDVFARDRVPGGVRELDFMPWGGAYNRVPPEATAFPHRAELFQLKHAAVLDPTAADATQQAARGFVEASWAAVHPWGSGRVFPNFPDPDLVHWADAYYGENLARLLDVKRRYDPAGLFRSPQTLQS